MTIACDFFPLANPGVRGLKPYLPGKPVSELERELGIKDIIKLASNENPLGPSPMAMAAVAEQLPETAIYPDGSGYRLKQKLAQKMAVDAECITLGNGSNDVLVLLANAFLSPQTNAVFSQYCFAVYPIATQSMAAQGKVAPANPEDHPMPLGHNLQAMAGQVDGNTRLVFIANPNNPTGSWVNPAELKDFVASMPSGVIVVIDEAYLEYAAAGQGADAIQWLAKFPNLVVCRTFSKAYGLAGLRVGYCVSNPQIADLLNRVRQPFNVNNLALAGAEAGLDDMVFIKRTRDCNEQGMAILADGLQQLKLGFLPSAGNFLLVRVGAQAMEIYQRLLESGVIVRPVNNYGLDHYLRVTIGTESQIQVLLAALRRVIRDGA